MAPKQALCYRGCVHRSAPFIESLKAYTAKVYSPEDQPPLQKSLPVGAEPPDGTHVSFTGLTEQHPQKKRKVESTGPAPPSAYAIIPSFSGDDVGHRPTHEDGCPMCPNTLPSKSWQLPICNCVEIRVGIWRAKQQNEEDEEVPVEDPDEEQVDVMWCKHWPTEQCCNTWIPQHISYAAHFKSTSSLGFLNHSCGSEKLFVCRPCMKRNLKYLNSKENEMDLKIGVLYGLEEAYKREAIHLCELEHLISEFLPEYIITGTPRAERARAADFAELNFKAADCEKMGMDAITILRAWSPKYQRNRYPIQYSWEIVYPIHQAVTGRMALTLAKYADWQTRNSIATTILHLSVQGKSPIMAFNDTKMTIVRQLWHAHLRGEDQTEGSVCQATTEIIGTEGIDAFFWTSEPMVYLWIVLTQGNGPAPDLLCREARVKCVQDLTGRIIYTKAIVNKAEMKKTLEDSGKSRIGWLNSYYSAPCREDEKHMSTRLANLVANCYKYDRHSPAFSWSEEGLKNRVIESLCWLLQNICFGADMNRAIAIFLVQLEPKSDTAHMLRWAKDQGLLLLSATFLREVFSAVSSSLRRYFKLPDGKPVSADYVIEVAYFEKCGPRAVNLAPAQAEYDDRCLQTRHLHYENLKSGKWAYHDGKTVGWADPDASTYARIKDMSTGFGWLLINKALAGQSMTSQMTVSHQWLASGSAGKAKVEIKGKLESSNKRVVLEKRGGKVFALKLKSKPKQVATSSNKFELDKARSLFAANIDHYVINSYATVGMEENINKIEGIEKAEEGIKARAKEFHRLRLANDPANHLFMADFANFNIHHSPAAMAALFDGFYEASKHFDVHEDYREALKWVRDSMYNSYIDFSGLGEKIWPEVLALQGMFSGTRSTDLINTLLNLIYFKMAREILRHRWNIDLTQCYHVHQGDDSFISSNSVVGCAALYYTMLAMGCKLQPVKQMAGSGAGEFLRVFTLSQKSRGFRWRAMGTLIERPIQESPLKDPVANIKAVTTQVNALIRRGLTLNVATLVLWDQILMYMQIKPHNMGRVYTRLPRALIYAPVWRGGIGCPPPGCEATTTMMFPAVPNMKPGLKDCGLEDVPTKMTQDWVDWLIGHFPDIEIDASALAKQAAASNYASVISQHTPRAYRELTCEAWRQYVDRVRAENGSSTKWVRLIRFEDKRSNLSYHIEQLRSQVDVDIYSATAASATLRNSFKYYYLYELATAVKKGTSRSPRTLELVKRARATAMKSTATILVAFKGNAVLLHKHLVEVANSFNVGGNELRAALRSISPTQLMSMLEADDGIRTGPAATVTTFMQPMDVTLCLDEALNILWDGYPEFKTLDADVQVLQAMFVAADIMLVCLDLCQLNRFDVLY